jgi:hypothetical protein
MGRASKSIRIALLSLGLAACGGTVVFEEPAGGDGGRGGTDDVTSTAAATRPSSSSTVASTSTGLSDCIPDSSHPCDGGATCIPIGQVCDGVQHCADASDEVGCEQPCNGTDFTCNDGSCIPTAFECDGEADCPGGEDEAFAMCGGVPCEEEGTLPCFDGICMRRTDVCDGQLECSAGEDEFPEICDGRICGTEISIVEPADAYCVSRFCCDPFMACVEAGIDECVECLNGGGGPPCAEAFDCVVSSCGVLGETR